VCKRASGKITRHQALNGVIARAFVAAHMRYSPGASAELAASRKYEKYLNLPNSHICQHIAFENVGTLNSSAVALVSALGRKISTKSNDLHESTFLFQRLAIALQRFNSVLL